VAVCICLQTHPLTPPPTSSLPTKPCPVLQFNSILHRSSSSRRSIHTLVFCCGLLFGIAWLGGIHPQALSGLSAESQALAQCHNPPPPHPTPSRFPRAPGPIGLMRLPRYHRLFGPVALTNSALRASCSTLQDKEGLNLAVACSL
jgi:hypothetical protein